MKITLPQDLVEFLKKPANRTLDMKEGEVRKAVFCGPDEIQKKKFDVNSYELYLNGHLDHDPEERKEYEGYDLVKEAGGYDAEGVLVWFPQWNEYGSWDCDHHRIITYPSITWREIAVAPTWYINGQWYPDRAKHREVNPWEEG